MFKKKDNDHKDKSKDSQLRISKYKTLDFPFQSTTMKMLFITALNILKFQYYYIGGSIFIKRSSIDKKSVKQCSKFIKFKLLFLTEKGLVPYENRT